MQVKRGFDGVSIPLQDAALLVGLAAQIVVCETPTDPECSHGHRATRRAVTVYVETEDGSTRSNQLTIVAPKAPRLR